MVFRLSQKHGRTPFVRSVNGETFVEWRSAGKGDPHRHRIGTHLGLDGIGSPQDPSQVLRGCGSASPAMSTV